MSLLLEENQRLTKIVASMEEFFQAQASALSLAPVNLNVRQIFDNLATYFEAAARNLEIEFRVETDDGATVYADPERLSQIL
ncbi:hypothetical protein NL521_28690, partial [Klebsiella pneumoniae]|nr:hypothetical protein [Klebsiella pneumoniae]